MEIRCKKCGLLISGGTVSKGETCPVCDTPLLEPECAECGVQFYCEDLGWEPAGKNDKGEPICAYCKQELEV